MTTSIIIPTYQRSKDLSRLLDSLSRLQDEPGEILVVIGPNDSESNEVVRGFEAFLPTLRPVQATRASVIHAMNLGFAEASGDIICLLDDDTSVPFDWLEKIVRAFGKNPKLGAYGGRDRIQLSENIALSQPEPAEVVGKFRWDGQLVGNHHCGKIRSPAEVDVIKGANFSFLSNALKPLQIDNVLIGFGAEPCWEIDICLRMRMVGYQVVYDNENWIDHYIAPRKNGDNRADLFASTVHRRAFNQFYITGKYRRLHELLLQFAHCVALGSRFQPGIVRSLILFPNYGFRIFGVTLQSLFAAVQGSVAGLKSRMRIISNKFYLENRNP